MSSLKEKKCVPCQGGEPTVTEEELAELKPEVPEWNVTEYGDVKHLERVFKFDNFAQALDFTNQVGDIAEEQNHHPKLVTEWGKVTVEWWTHKIGGLHENDFVMAAKTDHLYERDSAA